VLLEFESLGLTYFTFRYLCFYNDTTTTFVWMLEEQTEKMMSMPVVTKRTPANSDVGKGRLHLFIFTASHYDEKLSSRGCQPIYY
jgi:hypothetical protein